MTKPDCDSCPLNYRPPVFAKLWKSKLAIVGEAPGYDEEILGSYFMGQSGKVLRSILEQFGIPEPHINNAVRCRAPDNLSTQAWNQALACCKGRLKSELEYSGCTHILTLGRRAFHAVTDYKAHHTPWIGSVIEGTLIPNTRVIPSLHPAFMLRGNRQYLPILKIHADRAYRLSIGEPEYDWGEMHYYGTDPDKTIKALEKISFLAPGTLLGIDIETAGKDPLLVPITAIGIASKYIGVSIAWPPKRHFGNETDAKRASDLIKRILANPKLPKVAHNGVHDLLGLEKHGLPVNGYAHDTLLMHHVIAPSLKHDLGFVAQTDLDGVDPWKALFKVTSDAKGLERFLTASLDELTLYNCKDTKCLPILCEVLLGRLANTNNGPQLYKEYLERSFIAMKMREDGAKVDRKALITHGRNLRRNIKRVQDQINEAVQAIDSSLAYEPVFDWRKRSDLLALLFVHLGLDTQEFPNIDKIKLTNKTYQRIVEIGLTDTQYSVVSTLMKLKELSKQKTEQAKEEIAYLEDSLKELVPTFTNSFAFKHHFKPSSNTHLKYLFFQVLGVTPTSHSKKTGEPSLTTASLKTLRVHCDPRVRLFTNFLLRYRKYTKLYGSFIKPMQQKFVHNAYVRPSAKVWGTKTERWSYETPNIQQVTGKLRNIFISRFPDGFIAEADYSQAELRLLAFLSQDKQMLQWFAEGKDLHSETAKNTFGVDESHPKWKALRKLAKGVRFGMNYGGGAEKIWSTIAPDFPNVTISDVQHIIDVTYMLHPGMRAWQLEEVRKAEKYGYTENPFNGFRLNFHGEVDVPVCYNRPIQSGIAYLINRAIPSVYARLKENGDYLIFQVHDALICDTEDPIRTAKILKEEMERPVEYKGRSLSIPVDFKVGRNWGECIECKDIESVKKAMCKLKGK